MKILSVDTIVSHIVETDEEEYPIYRRNSPESWENLMGESWEPAYTEERSLEDLLQKHLRKEELE